LLVTFEASRKVLAEKGTEIVTLASTTSDKIFFTALGAISAAGQKLPLWVLAKVKTRRCERKFAVHPEVKFRHADSGWSTDNPIAYINWLHRKVAQGLQCILILDLYPGHWTHAVFDAADANDIELLFVPAGATGRFQPMDRRLFGEIKA
jgi:hypothetical protein